MNQSKFSLTFALILFALVVAAGPPVWAASSEWGDLTKLKPGQLIRVELNDARSYEGLFQAAHAEDITVRQSARDQTYARKDVQTVYFKDKNHRLRNTLIGAGIGVGLAAVAVKANHTGENTGIRSIGWVWPVGIGVFGGLGAAMPTGRWLLVYRVPPHR
jgi:hypothetical protein